MSPELKTIIDFCLAHAPDAPLLQRIKLYRSLAEFCGDFSDAAKFRSIADHLETADKLCLEFGFSIDSNPPATFGK